MIVLLLNWAFGAAPSLYGASYNTLRTAFEITFEYINPQLAYQLWGYFWSLLRLFYCFAILVGHLARTSP